jgi:hypothetical protein
MGPSIKKGRPSKNISSFPSGFVEIESTGKEVIVLDQHREIFVTRSDKVKDIQ